MVNVLGVLLQRRPEMSKSLLEDPFLFGVTVHMFKSQDDFFPDFFDLPPHFALVVCRASSEIHQCTVWLWMQTREFGKRLLKLC